MVVKNKLKYSEADINRIFFSKLKLDKHVVLSEVRLSPAEFDLVILDPVSLMLINIEIKLNKWDKLYQQAMRGQLYCHYSMVLIPERAKNNIVVKHYEDAGIGVIFFSCNEHDVDFKMHKPPRKSESMNRDFKKMIYKRFISEYGQSIYA